VRLLFHEEGLGNDQEDSGLIIAWAKRLYLGKEDKKGWKCGPSGRMPA
jgi:hypothetical protein